MDASGVGSVKEMTLGSDTAMEEEYVSQSKWLKEFTNIPSLDKAWVLKSDSGKGSKALFAMSQANLLANKRRKFVMSAHISEEKDESVSFEWAAFPIEMTGVSAFVPSPSGSKLLIVRNPENESPVQFEIWSASQLESEFQIPQSIHGSVYVDGWFEGVSWNAVEDHIAYVAEEPCPSKPTFNNLGYKKGDSMDKDCGSWKGEGDWEDDWGETYAGKRHPSLFVIDINSGEVRTIKGISKTLSVGQVIWAPSNKGLDQYLIFVGWLAHSRKLGIKYCYNRPCALYAVRAPLDLAVNEQESKSTGNVDALVVNLTQSISSAFFPRFSPDGKFLLFLSSKNSVDSWAHSATDSLHKIEWPADGKLSSSLSILDVVPVVLRPGNGCFPGLYCSNFISSPWLSDNKTMLISSAWRSTQVILSVDVLSGNITRITPPDSNSSWNVLALHGNNIVAVCSSPVDVPKIKYGSLTEKSNTSYSWSWSDILSPLSAPSEKIENSLSSLQFSIMEIPVRDVSTALTEGAKNPFEAIFVSATSKKNNCCDPLIVVIHGGPHSVALSSFSKSLAFLSSMGYSLLIVNYRGSLGFGEEALQSLPGNIGTQDVNDVLTAIDHVIDMGLADPSKITLLGGSHGGFLTTHLIGQAPDKFVAAVARNPVCNLALMSATSDIPDWCYIETFGSTGKDKYTEAPSAEHLPHLYYKSPISHIEKVKTPTLFLIGAQDLRVPPSNGLQYARTLKEKGVDVKIIVFPKDNHPIDRPQSDFESFLNIGVWFKKYCK